MLHFSRISANTSQLGLPGKPTHTYGASSPPARGVASSSRRQPGRAMQLRTHVPAATPTLRMQPAAALQRTIHLKAHLCERVLEDGRVLLVERHQRVHLLEALGLTADSTQAAAAAGDSVSSSRQQCWVGPSTRHLWHCRCVRGRTCRHARPPACTMLLAPLKQVVITRFQSACTLAPPA